MNNKGNNEKKQRMVLSTDKMSDMVYKFLDKKSRTKELTPYIISLVEKDISMQPILELLHSIDSKIDNIDSKIDDISSGVVIKKVQSVVSEDIHEGLINKGQTTEVKGELNDEDFDDIEQPDL